MFGPIELGGIERFRARDRAAAGVDTQGQPLLPLQADGGVDGDAVQPGEQLRLALEAVQRLIGVEEGLLDDILGVVGVVDQSIDRVIKAVLVAPDQLAKSCRSPLQTLSDKPLVVGAHGSLAQLDDAGESKVPDTRAGFLPPNLWGFCVLSCQSGGRKSK